MNVNEIDKDVNIDDELMCQKSHMKYWESSNASTLHSRPKYIYYCKICNAERLLSK